MEPLIPKINYRLIIAWLFATFFIFIIGGGVWELAFLPTLGVAALLGFRFVFPLIAANLNGDSLETIVVESLSSPDGIVTAKIEYTPNNKPSSKAKTFYRCLVKRNYQEGAFVQEEEFESLDLAEKWLEKAYQDELKKHEDYLACY
jgi:hypothetical protein